MLACVTQDYVDMSLNSLLAPHSAFNYCCNFAYSLLHSLSVYLLLVYLILMSITAAL